MALTDIHSLEKPVGHAPNAAYKTVHFTASDGVTLEGWYRPTRNGATVLVVPGGGSNRMGPLRHAKMLERLGYGVLVFDARGLGHSEGTPNSYGWNWDKDVDAALAYLKQRDEVDPARIGALGLSTGADMAIDAAGRRSDIAAVVADGSAAIGYHDIEEYTSKTLDRAPMWLLFKTMEVVRAGSAPKVSLADRIANTETPHLLVAAGKQEKEWGELYDREGGERSELWYLPEGRPHGRAQAVPRAVRAARQRVLRPPPRRLEGLQGRGLGWPRRREVSRRRASSPRSRPDDAARCSRPVRRRNLGGSTTRGGSRCPRPFS